MCECTMVPSCSPSPQSPCWVSCKAVEILENFLLDVQQTNRRMQKIDLSLRSDTFCKQNLKN